MKQTFTIIDPNGVKTTKTIDCNCRNEALFRAALNCKHKVETPKKGKGSYKRNKKIVYEY